MEAIVRDARYAVRLLVKERRFSLVAVLTLALGIGVTAALFSVIDSALLRPLPYANPDQLVVIDVEAGRDGHVSRYAPSIADVRGWRAAESAFSHVGVGRFTGFRPPIVDAGEAERLTVGSASEDLLEIFGVRPVVGRLFTREDTRDGAPGVALLGYRYWQSRFGGATDVIGRVIRIDNTVSTIVGVVPAGFYDKTAAWRPERFTTAWETRRGTGTPVYGRLRPGVTLAHAEAILTAITKAANPDDGDPVRRVVLTSMYDDETEGYGKTISVLSYAVGFILLIACVNVAGLLLARGAARQSELAIRASVGASRARLVRQLLIESLVLALAGTVLGVILSWLFLDELVALIPLRLPPNSPPIINGRVLAAAVATAAVSAPVFGLIPAIRLSRVHLSRYLAGRRHGPALSRKAGQILVAVEVALAVVLLAGAGLMVRSFSRLLAVGVGFDPETMLSMQVEPVDPSSAVRERYYADLLALLRASPEIAFAGALDAFSFDGGASQYAVRIGDKTSGLIVRQILPGYFEALGLSPQTGRFPQEPDRTSAEPLIVINQEAAKRIFPDTSPLGRTLQAAGKDELPMRVIGVVGNIRYRGPQQDTSMPEAFVVPGRKPYAPMTMVLRLRPGASISYNRLRELAQRVGPKVVIGKVASGSDWLGERVATPKHRTLLLALLGGFGLLLTLVGIFSVTAYAVARRTQEIGIRIAFGAEPADIVRTMVQDAVWPLAVGLAAGLAGAYFATAIVARFLFQTTAHDPATFAAVSVLMIVTACVAAWLPARRATRIDPVAALRAE